MAEIVALDYSRNDLYELGRTGGQLGRGTVIGIVIATGILMLCLGVGSAWALIVGGACAGVAVLAVLQRLFDVSVFAIDPDSRTFVIRRYLWRKLDEELTFPLDELEQFELENCTDERRVASSDLELTRIVARMTDGNLVPLNTAFSRNQPSAVDQLNARLDEVRNRLRS